jgi:hypothetical protein
VSLGLFNPPESGMGFTLKCYLLGSTQSARYQVYLLRLSSNPSLHANNSSILRTVLMFWHVSATKQNLQAALKRKRGARMSMGWH